MESPQHFSVLACGGDGIGPEVVEAGLELLTVAAGIYGIKVQVTEDLLHGAAYEQYGTFCREETVACAKAADAVLIGAVGGPKWDNLFPDGTPAEKDGLMRLRQELSVYTGLRPARSWPALYGHTPFRPELLRAVDILVVREMAGGVYFGEPRGIDALENGEQYAYDTTGYRSHEIQRIARDGFELARRRRKQLCSIDKANVMESGILWRETVTQIGREEYPDVALTHLYADNAMYQLVSNPGAFDVMLGDNLFSDISSDIAGAVAGSLGMLPSASLSGLQPEGQCSRPGIYESVHGSAPDIAGQGIANPCATLLSVAMMYEYAFARPEVARRIEQAVETTLNQGITTPDLGGTHSTTEVTHAVIDAFRQ